MRNYQAIKKIIFSEAGLLAASFLLYLMFFGMKLFHPNALLSSITGDSLKNYFTFIYHTTVDSSWLHFEGMNYPYGEHLVYTDCQPLISVLLRPFPVLHPWLIGIFHTLLFLSYIITPVIYLRIFKRLDLPSTFAWIAALGASLLAPQYIKLYSGHYALMYACVYPVTFLLCLKLFQSVSVKNTGLVFLNNLFWFGIHPYLGLSVCLLSAACVIFWAFTQKLQRWRLMASCIPAVLPLFLFQLFLKITDSHPERTSEPEGLDSLHATTGTFLLPNFGPFRELLFALIPVGAPSSEAYCYLGFATLVCLPLLVFYCVFKRTYALSRQTGAMLFAAVCLLLLAFGLHYRIPKALGADFAALNQFRAAGRFAWPFFYCVPIIMMSVLYKLLVHKQGLLYGLAITFLALNSTEAYFLYNMEQGAFWQFRNFFDAGNLNSEEKKIVALMSDRKVQAILPLPVFHTGSEVYTRGESNNAMIPSMLYAVHGQKPVISSLMSRTSIPETENVLNLLNPYKKNNPALNLLGNEPVMVIKTKEELFPNETEIAQKSQFEVRNDSLDFAFPTMSSLRSYSAVALVLPEKAPNNQLLFIGSEGRSPYQQCKVGDYHLVTRIDTNQLEPGLYIFSLKYHYSKKKLPALRCHLVVAENGNWVYNKGIRGASGYYEGFVVYEDFITIKPGATYEFITKGESEDLFHISDFMIRKSGISILQKDANDSLINNYPLR